MQQAGTRVDTIVVAAQKIVSGRAKASTSSNLAPIARDQSDMDLAAFRPGFIVPSSAVYSLAAANPSATKLGSIQSSRRQTGERPLAPSAGLGLA